MQFIEDIFSVYPQYSNFTVVNLQSIEEFIQSAKHAPSPDGLLCRPPWIRTLACFRAVTPGIFRDSGTYFGLACTVGELPTGSYKIAIDVLHDRHTIANRLRLPPVVLRGTAHCVVDSFDRMPSLGRWSFIGPPDDPEFLEHDWACGDDEIHTRQEWREYGVRMGIVDGSVTFFLGMAFCHCKNVTVVQEPLPRSTRRRLNRLGVNSVDHRVINIEPIRNPASREVEKTRNDTEASNRAMHLCRGHFACYGEQYGTKKLFGKYEGQYWVPQHVRGNLDNGLITKDYRVTV